MLGAVVKPTAPREPDGWRETDFTREEVDGLERDKREEDRVVVGVVRKPDDVSVKISSGVKDDPGTVIEVGSLARRVKYFSLSSADSCVLALTRSRHSDTKTTPSPTAAAPTPL